MSIELYAWVVESLLNILFVHQSFQAEHRSYWVNLSGTSVGDPRFARFLLDAIRRSPLPPGSINFEITETAVMRSVTEARKLMLALGEIGVPLRIGRFRQWPVIVRLPEEAADLQGMAILGDRQKNKVQSLVSNMTG